MSAVKILDTNVILEPVRLCMCGKTYEIDKTKIYRYSLEKINGELQLNIDGKIVPLIEMQK